MAHDLVSASSKLTTTVNDSESKQVPKKKTKENGAGEGRGGEEAMVKKKGKKENPQKTCCTGICGWVTVSARQR